MRLHADCRISVLAAISLALMAAWGSGAARAAGTNLPGGEPAIEFISPAAQEQIPLLPVSVESIFNTPIDPDSFKATLNGDDVTDEFLVTPNGATASLSTVDGIRPNLGAKDQTAAPNVLQLAARAEQSRKRLRAVQEFFVRAEELPLPDDVSTVIPPEGGTVSIPGFGSVTFPAGSFEADQLVTLSVTSQPATDALFQETKVMFDAGIRLPYEFRVNTGGVQPKEDFVVTFLVPESFREQVPDDSEVRFFGQNLFESDLERLDTFELFGPRFLADDTTVTATLPRSLFTAGRTVDSSFEGVVLLGTTPTRPPSTTQASLSKSTAELGVAGEEPLPLPGDAFVPEVLRGPAVNHRSEIHTKQEGECEGTTLGPPLEGELTVTSPFGPRDGSIGVSNFHYGTDYRAGPGTQVQSMADGTIFVVRVQRNELGQDTGWGQYVVVEHTDGSRTLYAHLQIDSPTVNPGDTVSQGDVIGHSGNSGGSNDPHLHVEYSPDGRIFDRDSKVDPAPCIGANVSGSITVRDNGSLADDAFSVAINGVVVCETAIGASNTCAVGNLRPGSATLTITATIAPDNVGTFEISLGDGLTFSDGTTVRSGTLPEGGSASFTIIIPES